MTTPVPTERLRILSVTGDGSVADFVKKVFQTTGDDVLALTDLAQGVAEVQTTPPDVAFVDVGIGQGASLALVHHVKAVSGDADVYALTRTSTLEMASQAISLGAIGLIVYPPSGDELLSAANAVRSRRAAARMKTQLRQEVDTARRALGYVGRLAMLADGSSRDEVALHVAEVFREAAGAAVAAVYLPAADGSTELRCVTVLGDLEEPLTYTDEMGLMRYARDAGLEVVPLLAGRLSAGHVLLGRGSWRQDPPLRMAAHALAAQATTTLHLVTERERSGRGTIKDGETSAYTFAYFVDVAGREIDKAHRHGRRFALATIAIGDPLGDTRTPPSTPVDVADAVLGAVRDSDVLARVDEREFYLLLPETSGLGAHSCRRRVLGLGAEKSGNAPKLSGVTMGVATYPHDGADLLKLLRMAKRRAEAARSSMVHKLRLARLSLPEMVDALLWDGDIAHGRLEKTAEAPRALEMPMVDVLTMLGAVMTQATRGGALHVVVTQRSSIGFAAAVKAHPSATRENVAIHVLDIRHRDGCEDLEALAIVGEHGAYALVGRVSDSSFQGIHAADPLLADLVAQRLADLAGVRSLD